MTEGTVRIARILGVDVRVHITWLVAVFLVTWSLARGFFPSEFPGWDGEVYWATGVSGAGLLFGSVLLHELAHCVLARARGLPVNGITLFIFGGVSAIQTDRENAADEFLIAIVGPLTSVALAGASWALTLLPEAGTPLEALLIYLTFINVALALFNLVPGFPLDGGRVLRAVLWGTMNDFRRATSIASFIGQGVAFGLIIWGVARLLSQDVMGGLWIALIGWFLNTAAEASRRHAQRIPESKGDA